VNGKPQFETRVEKIHTLRSVFDVRNIKKLPNVVIIYGYQDDPTLPPWRLSTLKRVKPVKKKANDPYYRKTVCGNGQAPVKGAFLR
ncbi:hypothetical protein MJN85_27715, partial [Salmonella enterica subsp. enterica serovar Anatum]|nr:hypothetical protein [Salmonella enterica subsp. enterica serovar Anatum]